MTDTGVGARVARKEDQRFIMGKGRYVDDIHLPRETYAYFLRSPHAHAKIDAIDTTDQFGAANCDAEGLFGMQNFRLRFL